jgi:hypothetical protein
VITCALANIVAVLVARDARSALSYYRSKSKGLEAKISTLRDLAYNDPIPLQSPLVRLALTEASGSQ